MAEFVRAIESDTGNVVELDLTPQWSKENQPNAKEQQAVIEGNAKYVPDTRPVGKPCAEIPPGFAPPRGWNGCSHGYFAPHLVWPKQDPPPEPPKPAAPTCGRAGCDILTEHKHGKGRPKGSKNKKPRVVDATPGETAIAQPAEKPAAVPGGSLLDTPGPAVEVVDPAKLAEAIEMLKKAGLLK